MNEIEFKIEVRELRAKIRRTRLALKIYSDVYDELQHALTILASREHPPETVKVLGGLALQLVRTANLVTKSVGKMPLEYTDEDVEEGTKLEAVSVPAAMEVRSGASSYPPQYKPSQSWLDQAIKKEPNP